MQHSLLWYVGAFVVALGVLVVVHELGHYLVARWVGIKVLRFSVGFGQPLLTRRFGVDNTEWVLAAFPLGGYVKMLDEREGWVDPAEAHRAFNRQTVGRRALVVVAGPVANLLLAVLLYWILFVAGVNEMRPIMGTPTAGSPVAVAGVESGDEVLSVSGVTVATMQEFRWQLLKAVADRQSIELQVTTASGASRVRVLPPLSASDAELDADFLRKLGFAPYQPPLKPIIGLVAPDSPAMAAGLRTGDRVIAINDQRVGDWSDLSSAIRGSAGKLLALTVVRDAMQMNLTVTPESRDEGGQVIWRIGVGVQDDPELVTKLMTEVRLGLLPALGKAVAQTWDTSIFSLRMMGRMLVGKESLKNISGPVTIADYAGQSASLGLAPFLKFLALISISLGVLNLLPVPILDGGHLLYYLIEVIKGGPLSERAMEIGQQIGIGLLGLLMAFAFYNDISRLVSG